MWSNSPAVQPKSPSETQPQFNQLLTAVEIPLELSANEKLARLRSIPPKRLLDAVQTIDVHQFRPTTDTGFIVPTLFESLDNGEFARKMLARNIRLVWVSAAMSNICIAFGTHPNRIPWMLFAPA